MRPKISNKNVYYYLKQTYGYSNTDKFFEITEQFPKHKEEVIKRMVATFTGYHLEKEKLVCFNPYTSKNEVLKIKNFNHIHSKEDLLKELSMLHKTRIQMLVQSRKRILQLSKKKTLKRDHDLTAAIINTKPNRLKQLEKEKDIGDKELEQEL